MSWAERRGRFPASWVGHLEDLDREGGSRTFTPEDLAAIDVTPDDRRRHGDLLAAARELLDELAAEAWATRTVTRNCRTCGFELPAGHTDDTCPNTAEESHSLTDEGPPLERHFYERKGVPRRYVAWLLALHGMNTRAPWQESFNWLVSTSYGRMVPVAIYKYGVVRPGVLARRRHAALREKLVARITRASSEAAQVVPDPRPDVVAHSFGTLLLGHALHEHPDLRVGRIVTLGCILRPDFDWATLVPRGQVEAVLNHFGTQDQWAARAHATIPDGGPAGRRGFDFHAEGWPEEHRAEGARPLFNVPADRFKHSDFFTDDLPRPTVLERQFTTVWQPFLTTRDIADVGPALTRAGNRIEWPDDTWQESRWPRRAITGGRGPSPYTYG